MEFASEMFIKAVLLEQRIAEVAVTFFGLTCAGGRRICAPGGMAGGICVTS